MFRTIGWRIFLSFSLLLITLSLVIGISSYEFTAKMVEQSSSNQLRVQSVSLSTQVQRHLRRLESVVRNFQSSPGLVSLLMETPINPKAVQAQLERKLVTTPAVEDYMVFDRFGYGIASSDKDWQPFNAAKEPFFIQGLKSYHFGNIYNSPEDGVIQLVSIPITFGGSTIGVLAAQVNLNLIYDLMDQKLGIGENSEALLLDSNLRFITPGKTGADDLQQSHLTGTPLVQHLKSREEFWVGQYKNFRGKDVLGTVIKIPGHNWYIAIERDYDELEDQVSSIIRGIVGATATLLILLIGTTYFITRSITRPVQALVEGAQRISRGDYQHPILIPSRDDEITFLATEFDKMRAKIATSQGRLIERLEESEQRRIDSERLAAIGTLAATMAHEIRNPLNAMSLLLAQIDRKVAGSDPTSTRLVESFRGEIQRLDRMVSNILDYSKPLQLEIKSFDLRSLIDEALSLYSASLDNAQIKVSIQASEITMVTADRDKMKQCIVNLLQNSIDAIGKHGEISIRIGTRASGIHFDIVDTGPGFPQEGRGRLFDLFYSTKEKGTGLGLSTVRKILDAHGATISLDNIVPHGAKVHIVFPIRAAQAP